jgi:hypothetical protein
MTPTFRFGAITFGLGALFALGLTVSGMTNPHKVVGFLNLAGDWDPSLILVMGGAIPVYALALRLTLRRPAPLLGGQFSLSKASALDKRLLLGAGIFGLGWGLAGVCPGPGIVSAFSGSSSIWVFLVAMITGMQLAHLVEALRRRRSTTDG